MRPSSVLVPQWTKAKACACHIARCSLRKSCPSRHEDSRSASWSSFWLVSPPQPGRTRLKLQRGRLQQLLPSGSGHRALVRLLSLWRPA